MLLSAVTAMAREPQSGYRGFIDWSNDFTTYTFFMIGDNEFTWFTGASTSHGYQINRNLYVGAGLMVEHNSKFDIYTIPVFADIRTDQTWGRFTPFGDLRIGYNFSDGGGIYFSPTVGYRFNLNRKMNLNVGIGLTLRGYATDKYNFSLDEGALEDGYYKYDWAYLGKAHHIKAMLALRLGIDF